MQPAQVAHRLGTQGLDTVDFPTVSFRRKTVEKAAHCALGRDEKDLDQGGAAGGLNRAKFHPVRFRH